MASLKQRRPARRTLRSKLFVLVLASIGLSVGLVATATTWRDVNRDAALQSQRLSSQAQVLASLSAHAAASNDRGQAFAAIRAVAKSPGVRYARLENAAGVVLAETGAGARLSTDLAMDAGSASPSVWSLMRSHTVQIATPIVDGGRPAGRLVILGELEGEAGRVLQSLLISIFAAALAALAALAVAWRLQRGISQPILALTNTVAGIRSSHDFGQRVDVRADDEVAELVTGFNAMLDEIKERDGALAEHMEGLERTVADRTADLRQAKDAAEAATNAKSEFLATMSHEIRTPMNGVMVMAEMLAAAELPPRQRRYAEVIAKSGSSLLAIINDILDLSKIEAGKLELELAPVDASDVADDVCSLFWERARAKGLDLAAYIDPATPRLVLGDEVRLRQIVGNLINNAVKFTETGGVLVQIEPRLNDRLRIAVHDTGIGIAPEKLGSVFGAFNQADQSTTRKYGGTGLGLAIVKKLVEAMDGEIQVTSKLGKGSVFTVEIPMSIVEPADAWPDLDGQAVVLPVQGPSSRHALMRYLARAGLERRATVEGSGLVIGDAAALSSAHPGFEAICLGEYGDATPQSLMNSGVADAVLIQPFRRSELRALLEQRQAGAPLREVRFEAQTQATAAPQFTSARVLVADDSAVNREVAIEALSRLGVTPKVVADGRAALEAAKTGAFDVILMDGSMPEMDGYEAAKAIRAHEAETDGPRTAIVALTAHMVGAAADAWREAGMDAVLHKPFTLAALGKTLSQFMTPTQVAAAPDPAIQASSAVVATREPAEDENGLFDTSVVAELEAMATAGRGEFVQRVRGLYRSSAPECVTAITAAAEAGDASELARAAHALKSMSLNIGARAVSRLAARIEHAARDGGRIDADGVREIVAAFDATLLNLDTPLGTPAGAQTAAADDEAALLADLRQAPARGEMSLVYQPQYDRDGVAIVGCEALLRWTHPTRGPISPAVFIPLAERHGLISPITNWVLGQAMDETADLVPLPISVNASALDFHDPSFVDRLAGLVRDHGFDPDRLEVEITETALMDDEAQVRRSIDRLHEMGIRVALDDFGVGYSSLSHLRLFAFDKLKIDKLFIDSCSQDPQAAAVVHGVVSIGRALGMKVVAEGVETEPQRKFLKIAGVHAIQGYLLGTPMPVDALRDLMQSRPELLRIAAA